MIGADEEGGDVGASGRSGAGGGGSEVIAGKSYTSEALAGLTDADLVSLAAGTDVVQQRSQPVGAAEIADDEEWCEALDEWPDSDMSDPDLTGDSQSYASVEDLPGWNVPVDAATAMPTEDQVPAQSYASVEDLPGWNVPVDAATAIPSEDQVQSLPPIEMTAPAQPVDQVTGQPPIETPAQAQVDQAPAQPLIVAPLQAPMDQATAQPPIETLPEAPVDQTALEPPVETPQAPMNRAAVEPQVEATAQVPADQVAAEQQVETLPQVPADQVAAEPQVETLPQAPVDQAVAEPPIEAPALGPADHVAVRPQVETLPQAPVDQAAAEPPIEAPAQGPADHVAVEPQVETVPQAPVDQTAVEPPIEAPLQAQPLDQATLPSSFAGNPPESASNDAIGQVDSSSIDPSSSGFAAPESNEGPLTLTSAEPLNQLDANSLSSESTDHSASYHVGADFKIDPATGEATPYPAGSLLDSYGVALQAEASSDGSDTSCQADIGTTDAGSEELGLSARIGETAYQSGVRNEIDDDALELYEAVHDAAEDSKSGIEPSETAATLEASSVQTEIGLPKHDHGPTHPGPPDHADLMLGPSLVGLQAAKLIGDTLHGLGRKGKQSDPDGKQ